MTFDFGEMFANAFEEKTRGLRMIPVQAKKCETHRELGDWFKNFAAHCKALRPPPEAA